MDVKSDILSNLTIKTEIYRKNFDLTTDNDNIITEHDGTLSVLRIAERQLPLIVGEYTLSVWNMGLGRLLDVDINELLNVHAVDTIYNEFVNVVNEGLININNYKKIIFIRTYILRADYRKQGITEEFVEAIYRDLYDEDNLIVALVVPFQDNPIDDEYYHKHKTVSIINRTPRGRERTDVLASKYYSLDELTSKNTDSETNEYKLFSVAAKSGFFRIGNSYLFKYTPNITISRMLVKKQISDKE